MGFLGARGTCSLSVVIRTLVCVPSPQITPATKDAQMSAGSCSAESKAFTNGVYDVSVGAGGAIVFKSDPVGEHEEMILKGRVLWRTVSQHTRAAPRAITTGT